MIAKTKRQRAIASRLRATVMVGLCGVPVGCYGGLTGPEQASGASEGEGAAEGSGGQDDSANELPEGACVTEAPEAAALRRLNNAEYVATIADTLNVDIAAEAAALFPAEVRSGGFSNTSTALLVTYDRVESYRALAKSVAAQVPTAEFATATACTDLTEACERPLVEAVGHRLWRRPLTASEVDGYLPIFAAVLDEGETFAEGTALVIEAMLQSPQFLYRIEDEWPEDGQPGEVRALDSYEIASRLSYLVWGSAPDTALYTAAAEDALRDEDVLQAQVRRMLELPRARETSLRYIEDWLALEGLPTLNRDPVQYPGFNSGLAAAMREESLALADALLWEQRAPISALLTADFTIVSAELAEFYGFATVVPGVTRYELSDTEHRLGLLTHAGILAVNGNGNRPSIVERGLFMLGGVLCRGVAAPPADLDTSMSELEEGQSGRYYSEARLANTTCESCHGQFDSLGYAFETFDGVGAYQTADPNGNALRQDGWYFDEQNDKVPFETAEELVSGLSELDSVIECIGLRKPLQFAVGRPLGPDDACALETISETLVMGDGSYQDLLVAIATHPTFRVIRTAQGQ